MHVAGLREDIVCSPEQVLALLDSGERHRHFGETKMNKNSSRCVAAAAVASCAAHALGVTGAASAALG